ncbi:MAG: NapC/NirT family cytochrome c [Rhodoblastus sp.]|nr:MAG: NapC/NirT family cytochrome c [Rhodoblastus sp.]
MSTTDLDAARPGVLARLWRWFKRPSAIGWGFLALGFFVAGILFWGGFHWALEATNTEQFCISCHEMRDNVYQEYRKTAHYSNKTGVRASCPDCHVPKDWRYKLVRKMQASRELWGKAFGSIDTPEKFAAHRVTLSKSEWRRMKTTDSRECRNCHNFKSMEFTLQEPRAAKLHQEALNAGKTCIDCHQGVAHRLPAHAPDAYTEMLDTIDKVGPIQQAIDFLQDADVQKAKAAPR